MPKQEYNDLYLQLMQVKAQNSKLLYELLMQKQNWFQKNSSYLISLVTISASFLLSYLGARWAFKSQVELEEKKKIKETEFKKLDFEQKNKELERNEKNVLENNYRRIYSELSSTLYDYLDISNQLDYHKIHYDYYIALQKIYVKYNLPKDKQDYVLSKRDNEYEKMMAYSVLLRESNNRINKISYEYQYLKKDTGLIELILEFTDHINGFSSDDIFSEITKNLKTEDTTVYSNLRKYRSNEQQRCATQHETLLIPIIYRIQNLIKKETNNI